MSAHLQLSKWHIAIAAICVWLIASKSINAQSIPCSAFSITQVYADTINPGNYQFGIQFAGNPNDFANYPYVSVVRDCNGDTIATGTVFYFGQLGATTQDYPVTLTGNGSATCYPLTASFIINFTDTCQLVFNPTGVHESSTDAPYIFIYPNPTSSLIQIDGRDISEKMPFTIYDITGKMVKSGLLGFDRVISVDEFRNGIYFLTLEDGTSRLFQVLIE